jgi:signal recognition particle subunit SRP54
MVKEICNALIESDVNIKLVASLRTSIKRTVNFSDQSPGVNKKRLIQKVWIPCSQPASQKHHKYREHS